MQQRSHERWADACHCLGRLFAVAAALLAGCANTGGPTSDSAARPKNIIILFADGAAPTQWELGKYSARVLRNQAFATTDIVFRQGTLGLLSTHSSNAFVTDSAAAASAMSTGSKVNNYTVAIDPAGKRLRTVMEAAKASGRKIGLVTTAEIYDASPAAFSVHANRGEDQSIVDQYLALEPDVLIGGGRDYFLPKGVGGGKRSDGNDLRAAFAGKAYQIVSTPQELISAQGPRVLALFADGDMALEIDRDGDQQPSIADMTRTALRLLSRDNPNGFVLFVESENTDSAGHQNDIAALIHALWAFDDAVRIALEFQRTTPGDTLLIVTGDHETGGLSATYAQGTLGVAYADLIYTAPASFQMVSRIKGSLASAARALGRKPTRAAVDALIAERFPGFTLDQDLRDSILAQRPLERNFYYVTQTVLARMVARQTGIYWGTSGHTTQPVAVGAMGPGAELFRGYQDNTDFGRHLHRLIDGR